VNNFFNTIRYNLQEVSQEFLSIENRLMSEVTEFHDYLTSFVNDHDPEKVFIG
jgi:hypothetical protein